MEKLKYLRDGKIDTSDEGIAFWATNFKCSETVLKEAIYKIGTIYNVLLMYLEMNNFIDKE